MRKKGRAMELAKILMVVIRTQVITITLMGMIVTNDQSDNHSNREGKRRAAETGEGEGWRGEGVRERGGRRHGGREERGVKDGGRRGGRAEGVKGGGGEGGKEGVGVAKGAAGPPHEQSGGQAEG